MGEWQQHGCTPLVGLGRDGRPSCGAHYELYASPHALTPSHPALPALRPATQVALPEGEDEEGVAGADGDDLVQRHPGAQAQRAHHAPAPRAGRKGSVEHTEPQQETTVKNCLGTWKESRTLAPRETLEVARQRQTGPDVGSSHAGRASILTGCSSCGLRHPAAPAGSAPASHAARGTALLAHS